MVITIDGPAGAGKSSAARNLAKRLGFNFLDTGAMYRAVALAAIQAKLDWSDSRGLEEVADRIRIHVEGSRTYLNGRDVSTEIRSPEVTAATRHVADHAGIRRRLVALQRSLAVGKNVVTEGRDQGTVAFPDADCKIFLTASAEERARRRARQFGDSRLDWQQILQEQSERDRQDENRAVGRLPARKNVPRYERAVVLVSRGLGPACPQERLVRERSLEVDALQ